MKIKLNNVSKTIKDQKILDNINAEFESGKVYGIVGRNGSGKTMLFRGMSGLMRIEGEVWQDEMLLGRDMRILKNLGIIIENTDMYLEFSGYMNLKFLADINKKIGKKEIRQAMKDVGLNPDEKKSVGKYSLGMRQKLSIAQAIMEKPDVLLLDEPTNGLDPNGINSLLTLIKKLAKNYGLTFIISSHILSNLEQVCTKNYLLKNHKLIYLDDSDNVKYKIYTEDLSLKSLMTLLKLNGIPFERQKHDILVKGLAAVKQVMDREGIPFTYEKEGLSEVLFNEK